ncbi:MAG: PrsW family intramembrane metalloprotease [Prevotellaceae bacterium]|nr:PrsW family intramembrane metalloprotease [Prevotellaceae bacterium]
MRYCGNCGREMPDDGTFCGYCGAPVSKEAGGYAKDNTARKEARSSNSPIVGGISDYVGNTHSVQLNWKVLFADVFKRHTREEAEDIFICGTTRTTPPLNEISDTWPKPWLYSRVFLCFLVTYVLLYVCSVTFDNANAYPGLIVIGAFAVPFTTLVLFLEMNVFRNISVYNVMKFFLIGGGASLVVTLFLFSLDVVDTDPSSAWGAMMVGVTEELGKLVIVYILIKSLPSCDYILCALLVGACVGAGFAAFESAGYAMRLMLSMVSYFSAYGVSIPAEQMMDSVTNIIYLRGLLAPGGHVAWAAVSGAALILAKGSGSLTTSVFSRGRFWKIFLIPVVLHGLWDAPFLSEGYVKYVILLVLVWVFVMVFINMGLDEVKEIKRKYT